MKDGKIKYEIVAVLKPKIEGKESILDKIASWLDQNKAKIEKKENLGIKDLAYKVADFSRGDFWVLDVEADKALKLNELNLFLNREVNIIRYLILRK